VVSPRPVRTRSEPSREGRWRSTSGASHGHRPASHAPRSLAQSPSLSPDQEWDWHNQGYRSQRRNQPLDRSWDPCPWVQFHLQQASQSPPFLVMIYQLLILSTTCVGPILSGAKGLVPCLCPCHERNASPNAASCPSKVWAHKVQWQQKGQTRRPETFRTDNPSLRQGSGQAQLAHLPVLHIRKGLSPSPGKEVRSHSSPLRARS
jgi:hypothetical protein